MAFQVTCVTTDDRSNYHDCRCIEKIGYQTSIASFQRSPATIHDKIKNGTDFYILHNGSRTYLEAVNRGTTKYVRTESNDTSADNLLNQPSC